MNNDTFISLFRDGKSYGNYSNLKIVGNELIFFKTVIARRVNDGNLRGVELNTRKYSRSTTNIQNKISRLCNVVGEFYGERAIF